MRFVILSIRQPVLETYSHYKIEEFAMWGWRLQQADFDVEFYDVAWGSVVVKALRY
jgi:hypothetical protein